MISVLVMLLGKSGNTLKKFKLRRVSASVIAVYLDLVAQLKQKIGKSAVFAETDDPGAAFSGTAEDIHQFQFVAPLVDAV